MAASTTYAPGVLVVDDNSTVRGQAVRLLKTAGFTPLEAASLAQARALLRAPLVAVVLADRLPELKVPAVVVASSADSEATARAIAAGAQAAVDRRLLAESLVATVRRLATPARKPAPTPMARPAAQAPAAPARLVAQPGAPAEAVTVAVPTTSEVERPLFEALRGEAAFLRNASYYRV